MYWVLVIAAFVLATVVYKLGATTVWVAVLTTGLKVVLLALAVIAAVLGLLYLRRRFK